MCPAKHAQSWGSPQERKGWVGGGYTKLNNSRKSTEQGLNFPLCCLRFFNRDPNSNSEMKRNQCCCEIHPDGYKLGEPEDDRMANPLW